MIKIHTKKLSEQTAGFCDIIDVTAKVREQIEKQMPLMRAAVRGYVEEMGITDSFFERMFNTEPSHMEILYGENC